MDDELLFVLGEPPPLDVRAEVVRPPEAAALATPVEARELRQPSPAPVAVLLNVVREQLILLRRPRPLL